MIDIPKVNETYDYYDDGKICESRHDKAKIIEIIDFNNIDKQILDKWKNEADRCYWLYKPITDYFIKAYLMESKQEVIFVRTIYNGWFSLGWWAGLLDVNNIYNY
jgi:hypothetical protein